MNFVFISPHFPDGYWQWCDRLRRNGATVLGIGDAPYDSLDPRLTNALAEYYYVPTLEDYDQVFKAVAFFSYKWGKIDWIESNNEHWLPTDARLRSDFHVTTGASSAKMSRLQSKVSMKSAYAKAGVPSARQVRVTTLKPLLKAIEGPDGLGWPVFVKPEYGVGSGGAERLDSCAALEDFLARHDRRTPYVLEEFVEGQICSYDAINDAHARPLFENMEEFPPSMQLVSERALEMSYWCHPDVDPALARLGRAVSQAFGLSSRFVHMEFFRLEADKPGLGRAGDYVGLEVNVRPPGGWTPDMMNFAHSLDVYQVWADMVTKGTTNITEGAKRYFCAYAGRRDGQTYAHSHQDILSRFGDKIVMCQRVPDVLSDDMANQMYIARLDTRDEKNDFVDYVLERAEPADAETIRLSRGAR